MTSDDKFFDDFAESVETEKKSETMSFRIDPILKDAFYNEVPNSMRTRTIEKFRYEMKLAIHIARFDPDKVLNSD